MWRFLQSVVVRRERGARAAGEGLEGSGSTGSSARHKLVYRIGREQKGHMLHRSFQSASSSSRSMGSGCRSVVCCCCTRESDRRGEGRQGQARQRRRDGTHPELLPRPASPRQPLRSQRPRTATCPFFSSAQHPLCTRTLRCGLPDGCWHGLRLTCLSAHCRRPQPPATDDPSMLQPPQSASSTSSDQGGPTKMTTAATPLPLKRGSACQYCRCVGLIRRSSFQDRR